MAVLLVSKDRGITRGIALLDPGGNTIVPTLTDQIRATIGRTGEAAKLVVHSDNPTANGSSFVKGTATNVLRLDASDLTFGAGVYSLWVDYFDSAVGEWQMVDSQVMVLIGTGGEEESSSSSSSVSSQSSSSSPAVVVWAGAAEGDSIVASGGLAGEPSSHARLLPAQYTPQPVYTVFAVAGTNMTDMENRFDDAGGLREFIIAQRGLGKTVLVSVMMGNALIEESPAAAYLDYIQWSKDCRALGAKVIICDTLYRDNPVLSPGWETGVDVNTLNALIASNLALFDEHCRFNDDAWSSLANANNLLYSSDGIHKTALWYSLSLPRFKANHDNLLSTNRPVVTFNPDFSGTPRYGETLICQPGTSNATSRLFQWLRSSSAGYDVQIGGATSNEYTCQPEDVDKTLICKVQHTKSGISVYVLSNRSTVVTSFYGVELIPEGNFGAGLGSFTVTNATMAIVNGKLEVTTNGNFHGRAKRTFSTVANQWYRLTFDFTLGVGLVPGRTLIQNGEGGSTISTLNYATSGGQAHVFQALGATTYMDFRFPSDSGPEPVGSTILIDNVSVKQLQTTP